MGIRKAPIETDGEFYYGYEDLGTENDGDDRLIASQVLVFMLVAMNECWKIPIAYFFTAGIAGELKVSMLTKALVLTYESGITVKNTICDGASNHFAMGTVMDAKLNVCSDDFQGWFSGSLIHRLKKKYTLTWMHVICW